jgi:TldD protein
MLQEQLLQILGNCTADYADIRFEESDAVSFAFRGVEQDSASTSRCCRGVVRACRNGGWGTVVFDSIRDAPECLSQACHLAKLVGKERTLLGETTPVTGCFPARMKTDFREIPLPEKIRRFGEYNALLSSSDPSVHSTLTRYRENFRKVYFASTRGACFMEERPHLSILLAAIARKDDLIQQAFKSIGSLDDYGVSDNLEEECRAVGRRARDLTLAPKAPGGKTTVVLDPEFAGLFTHEAFGHLSEADFLYENRQMRELMTIGRPMGQPCLNIVDDGALPGGIGTHATDDEGTPTRRNYLIRDGKLAGHLHSLETAGKMGEAPTGNCRAISGSFAPIVRMTNTFILPGRTPKEELFRDIDDGIYACGGFAGQTMMEMFTFTATHGYRIRNGKICELLRDVMVTGNVFETLRNIDAISGDLEISRNGGGCGKGGQSPLPVSDGAPHIRVRNAIVAGA